MGFINQFSYNMVDEREKQQGKTHSSRECGILAVEVIKESIFLAVVPTYSTSFIIYGCHKRSEYVLQIPDILNLVHDVVLQLLSPGKKFCSVLFLLTSVPLRS